MSGVGGAEGFGLDTFRGERALEALGLVGRQGGGCVVENEKGRDTFAGRDVGGRGVVGPELRLAAEDLAVAVFRLGLAGGFTIRGGQFNDRWDVEVFGIDRDSALEHREG